MITSENNHLSEEEIIIAVVDAADLNRLRRLHLAQCGQCRSQIEAVTDDLNRIGRIAESTSPAVKRPFRAPSTVRGHARRRPFGRRLAAGLTVAVVCVVIGGLLWQNQLKQRDFAREMAEAEQLMRQVDRLVENPLPKTIMTIAAEGTTEHDEDFFRFLIPEENGDTTTSRSGKKGLIT